MRRICFETICEAWAYGIDKFTELLGSDIEYPMIDYVGDYYVISDLLEHFVADGFSLESVKIENPDFYEYDKEYVLTVTPEGITVSPLWHEKNEFLDEGYYMVGADYVFIHEDCNSKILNHIDSDPKDIIEFGIGEWELDDFDDDCECDGNCEGCHLSESEDDDEPNISVKVNGKEVFGREAEAVIKDSLLRYCEMMDLRNELLSRFW